jgi:hypothetical protein
VRALSSILFTTPLMLAGIAAVSLPIAAHLLSRRTRQRITFPTIELLKQAAAGQSRLFRLRRPLLLALRCLVLTLIALAFARPVWLEGSASGATGGGSAVVLVIDASASLGQRVDGVSLVTTMNAAASSVLDQLQPGVDVANVIVAAARPRAAFAGLISNIESLRAEVARLEPTAERADLPAALAAASHMLADRSGPRRIIILSDLQRTNWDDVQLPSDTLPAVTVIPIGSAAGVNTSLTRPRVFPPRLIVNRPARFTVTVGNPSDRARTVDLSLLIDNRAAGSRRELLQPGEQRDMAIDAAVNAPGSHEVVFVTGRDDLPIDDRRPLVVEAVQRVPVTLIADDLSPTSAAFYISRALAPTGSDADELAVKTVSAASVTAETFRGSEVVILADAGPLSPTTLSALHSYLTSGGGLLIFCGDGEVTANLTALDRLAPATLPWLPLTRRNLPASNTAAHITDGLWSSPTLGPFDEAAREALATIPIHRPFTTTPPRPSSTTLLKFNDGSPALSIQNVGQGKLALANFSPAPRSSDLGKHGLFVALLHSLVDTLRPQPAADADAVVGQPLTRSLPIASLDAAVTITTPDGRKLEPDIRRAADHTDISLPALPAPGIYRIHAGDHTSAFAAHIDDRESDLRRMDLAEVSRRLSIGDRAPDIAAVTAADHPLRVSGTQLWPALIVAAMLALGLELALLTYWKR